jgi:hypothetical protein
VLKRAQIIAIAAVLIVCVFIGFGFVFKLVANAEKKISSECRVGGFVNLIAVYITIVVKILIEQIIYGERK